MFISNEIKVEILNEFMRELKYSGYSEKDREKILIGGINTYSKLKNKENNGERPFYRPKSFQREERRCRKLDKPRNWYKDKNENGKNFGTVMFVEATKDNKLLKMLEATEEVHKISDYCRVKFVSKSVSNKQKKFDCRKKQSVLPSQM